MHDINKWLLALSFLIGLALTFALMIRRVTREVPVTLTVSAAAAGAAGSAAASAAKFVADAEVQGPYGAGSAKADADGSGPAGWTIKGNADSMLYHTTESPWYAQTIAEVWFNEEDAARKAGFTRWDAGKDGGGSAKAGGSTKRDDRASLDSVPAGPYGRGSAAAGADGSGPVGWTIKGNADSMLYHPLDSPAYEETIAEVWFFDEKTAKAAGFDPWDKNFQ